MLMMMMQSRSMISMFHLVRQEGRRGLCEAGLRKIGTSLVADRRHWPTGGSSWFPAVVGPRRLALPGYGSSLIAALS